MNVDYSANLLIVTSTTSDKPVIKPIQSAITTNSPIDVNRRVAFGISEDAVQPLDWLPVLIWWFIGMTFHIDIEFTGCVVTMITVDLQPPTYAGLVSYRWSTVKCGS